MKKKRRPMQVDESFMNWYKKMRVKVMDIDGRELSARELTEKICKSPELIEIEKRILSKQRKEDTFNVRLRFDRRII